MFSVVILITKWILDW